LHNPTARISVRSVLKKTLNGKEFCLCTPATLFDTEQRRSSSSGFQHCSFNESNKTKQKFRLKVRGDPGGSQRDYPASDPAPGIARFLAVGVTAKSQIVGLLVDDQGPMEHAAVRFGRQGDEVVKQEEIGERVAHGVDVAQIANVTNVIAETAVILLSKRRKFAFEIAEQSYTGLNNFTL